MTKVLYVDPDPIYQQLFLRDFQDYFQVKVCGSTADIDLHNSPYDVLFSEQDLANRKGIDFLEQVKEQFPGIIRIIITQKVKKKQIIEAINRGQIAHIVIKPWDQIELKSVIDRALELKYLAEQKSSLDARNIRAQFEALKNQISPHFLFNALNVLTILIEEDPQKAAEYSRTFAKLYRTLLTLDDHRTISLGEELELVNNYIHLQKVRFEDGLIYQVDVPNAFHSYRVPPCAIQLLVENAIKHNTQSIDKPLSIIVRTDEQHLLIENTLQPRKSAIESTHIGLENLIERYQLLGAAGPNFETHNNLFSVTIPLLDPGFTNPQRS